LIFDEICLSAISTSIIFTWLNQLCKRLASETITMESFADGWIYCNEANQLAVPNSMSSADVNGDGAINITDVMSMVDAILGVSN
jgi:hypothetical protein